MGKYTLEIEPDYDFVLIGISSHEKDYRFCWALNKKLNIELTKRESLEIKGKKQNTPSFFSFFLHENPDEFLEYAVIANLSEGKSQESTIHTLFGNLKDGESDSELLIPEQKQMDYFFLIRAEIEDTEIQDLIKKIREMDNVQTTVRIDPKQLKSKQNLIF